MGDGSTETTLDYICCTKDTKESEHLRVSHSDINQTFLKDLLGHFQVRHSIGLSSGTRTLRKHVGQREKYIFFPLKLPATPQLSAGKHPRKVDVNWTLPGVRGDSFLSWLIGSCLFLLL